MKTTKLLISAILLLALAACKHQTTPVKHAIAINAQSFPDANLRNFLLAQPYGADSLLTDDEIAATTSLNLSGLDIADLTGIAHFTALKDLACVGNQLTTLSLAGLPALNYLNCADNQLTTLTIADLPALNYLDCGNNRLDTLNLADCPALRVLACTANRITAIDLSHTPSLNTLICSRNQLSAQAIDTLISSLPQNPSDITCSLCLYDNEHADEANTCTRRQVAAAKAKGWTVYHYRGKDWEKYDGSGE